MKGENELLRGNWATLLLPIAADESIDFGRLAEEIDLLVAARVDGIYSNGTAGEFHNQTEAEYAAIQALLAEKCRAARVPFVIGACQPDPSLARERVRLARDLGPAAIQVVLPDPGPGVAPPLQVEVEHGAGVADLDGLARRLEELIRGRLSVAAAVRLVPPESIPFLLELNLGVAKNISKLEVEGPLHDWLQAQKVAQKTGDGGDAAEGI